MIGVNKFEFDENSKDINSLQDYDSKLKHAKVELKSNKGKNRNVMI